MLSPAARYSAVFALLLSPAVASLAACQTRSAPLAGFTGDKQVVIQVKGDTVVSVNPLVAVVKPGTVFTFKVEGLGEGQSIEVDFKVDGGKKGPFPPGRTKVRGRFAFTSGAPSEDAVYDETFVDRVFKYDIILRDGKGADVYAIDPMIVGKGGI